MCLNNLQEVDIRSLLTYKLFTFCDGKFYNAFSSGISYDEDKIPIPLTLTHGEIAKDGQYHSFIEHSSAIDVINRASIWNLFLKNDYFICKDPVLVFCKIKAYEITHIGTFRTGSLLNSTTVISKRYVIQQVNCVYDYDIDSRLKYCVNFDYAISKVLDL